MFSGTSSPPGSRRRRRYDRAERLFLHALGDGIDVLAGHVVAAPRHVFGPIDHLGKLVGDLGEPRCGMFVEQLINLFA
jgi:hypothetical protein